MKITENDLQSQLSVYKNTQIQDKDLDTPQADRASSPIALQDRVALSGRGKRIADAQRAVSALPDIREELVERIRTEIQNGTYVVDGEKSAQGLLKESMTNLAALS